jgi:DNA-binding transcriptional regulator YhcF (GntR family)
MAMDASARTAGPRAAPTGADWDRIFGPLPAGPSRDWEGGSTEGAVPVQGTRELILAALHAGQVQPGDRLPSIREMARTCGMTAYAVTTMYKRLEEEGLLEARDRSGVFVTRPQSEVRRRLPDTASWLVEVLVQAFEHQLKVTQVADLVRSWTAGVRLRCVCAESIVDARVALETELREQFGLQSTSVSGVEEGSATAHPPPAVRNADILVTTCYHAHRLQAIARTLGKPVVVATLNPAMITAIRTHVRDTGQLTVICAEPAFGERVRAALGRQNYHRVRVVPAEAVDEVDSLNHSQPVLMTIAARQRLGERAEKLRLVVPHSPSFSPEFAHALLEHIIALNLRAPRA